MSRMMTALVLISMALSSVAWAQGTPTITIPGVGQIIPIDIQVLSLNDTKVTDSGIGELAALKSLFSLSLGDTNVTDIGVKKLAAALTSLTWLSLSNTKVTNACVKELRAKLPKCKIYN